MRMLSIAGMPVFAMLALALASSAAEAQVDSREGIALQNQIYQLRQDVQTLRDQLGHGGIAPSRPTGPSSISGNDMVAQLLTRVDGMEDQLRQLRGRIDELQNQIQRQNADLGKRVDDLTYQMGNRAGSQPPAGPPLGGSGLLDPSPTPPMPINPPHGRTPEMAMQEGNAALARRDYAGAEAAAREIVAAKASPRAYDGQMLLAQALFGERKYSDAALAYDDTYKRSRKGTHAQDALLGLANSLVGVNEKRAACGTLDKLRSEFPQPRADLRDGIAAATQRAGCR